MTLKATLQNGKLDKRITEDLIYAQGSAFFLAGLDTTATALTNMTYQLAKSPGVQVISEKRK